jgi:Domain of unknown function (DUF1876)
VGWVAYATDAGARILPVNYVLGADCVIFCTVPDGEIFRYALDSTGAFEIGETNEFFESGWRSRSWAVAAGDRRRLRSDAVWGGCLSLGQPVADRCSYDCVRACVRTEGDRPWSVAVTATPHQLEELEPGSAPALSKIPGPWHTPSFYTDARTLLRSVGETRRNRSDADVPDIGDEATSALHRLADRLL